MNERQKHILETTITLLLSEGISVSTARIAKVAGVSNGTLFNAFATKQDLLDAIYLATKSAMFDALPYTGQTPLSRANLRTNWDGYVAWARGRPEEPQVMHLLRQAGLISEPIRAQVDARAADHAVYMAQAHEQGLIRGPSVEYISELIFAYIDLVIKYQIEGKDEDLAFDMLCNSIGLNQ